MGSSPLCKEEKNIWGDDGNELAVGKPVQNSHHVLDVNVRALLQEILHELIVTLLNGQVQGSATALWTKYRMTE